MSANVMEFCFNSSLKASRFSCTCNSASTKHSYKRRTKQEHTHVHTRQGTKWSTEGIFPSKVDCSDQDKHTQTHTRATQHKRAGQATSTFPKRNCLFQSELLKNRSCSVGLLYIKNLQIQTARITCTLIPLYKKMYSARVCTPACACVCWLVYMDIL